MPRPRHPVRPDPAPEGAWLSPEDRAARNQSPTSVRMTPPVHNREEAIREIFDRKIATAEHRCYLPLAPPGAAWLRELRDEIVDVLLSQPDPDDIKVLCDYVRNAAGDESVLLNSAVLEQFSDSEAHKLRLKLGRAEQEIAQQKSLIDHYRVVHEMKHEEVERLRAVEKVIDKTQSSIPAGILKSIRAVLSSQEPSTDHTQLEEK